MDVTQEAVRDVCTDAVFERGENYLAEGRIREIPPSLFHFLTLTLSVVVFVENARPHVCAVTDDIFRNIAIQVVSDTATPEGVWTFTREAAEGGSILHRFATLRIAVVWTRSSRNIGLGIVI